MSIYGRAERERQMTSNTKGKNSRNRRFSESLHIFQGTWDIDFVFKYAHANSFNS